MSQTTIREQLIDLGVFKEITHYRVGNRDWDAELINKFFGKDWDSAETRPAFKFHVHDAFLNVRFSKDWGGEGQPPIIFYAPDYIVITTCYDGATDLVKVPLVHNNEDSVDYYGGGK